MIAVFSSRAAGWLMRVAMIVSLWNAPLPWLNIHGTLAGVEGDAACLAQHLVRFHAAADLLAEAGFGWHVHFVLPWNGLGDGPCPAGELPRHETPGDDAAPAVGAAEWSSVAARLGPPCGGGVVNLCDPFGDVPPLWHDRRPCSGPLTAHFLQSGSVSLCALLCVARC